MFTVDSLHEGTVIHVSDKSATIALPYGVEAYAPVKQLRKEDGTTAKADEKLNFLITEFNKDAKKIVVSHTRTFDNAGGGDDKTAGKKGGAKKGGGTSKAVKEINQTVEKTTLGDLDGLAKLKSTLEDNK